jgi:hypothetical protein
LLEEGNDLPENWVELERDEQFVEKFLKSTAEQESQFIVEDSIDG